MITFKNFSYKYINSNKLNVDNFNIKIERGDCVLFTGNSGCGKTTILRLLNGLAPEFFPGGYEGSLKVAHLEIGDKLKDFSKIVGSVFQNPKNQFFNLDSTSELAFSMENYGYAPEKIANKINEVTAEFQAEHLLDRNILELSGGEKQKLAFMASMMLDADIYVLDEVTSNLDLKSIKLISNIIEKLKEKGKTVIIAEHRIYYLKNIIDKMYIIRDGRVLHEVDKESLRNFNGTECKTRQIDLNLVEIKDKDTRSKKNSLVINKLAYKVNKRPINIENEKFEENKIYAIVGDNGCGKTTFANALSGLIKTKNDVILYDKKVKNKDLVKNSFQVMQDVNYQLFTNNVEKEIKLGSKNLSSFDTIVDKLKIRQYLDRHPNTLSGGEKQRVAIASALLSNKKILIFDEPTSGLDYTNMIELSNLIRKVNENNDVVIFVITHDYEFLCTVADEIVHFDNEGIKSRLEVSKNNKNKILQLMGI